MFLSLTLANSIPDDLDQPEQHDVFITEYLSTLVQNYTMQHLPAKHPRFMASGVTHMRWASQMLRAKDPKVQCARVCKTVAGLVLQGTQVTNADPWMHDKEVLHACRQLAMIMKDVEESLDDVRDDFEEMRTETEVAVEATTLGIKPSQA